MDPIATTVRRIVCEHAQLVVGGDELSDETDLYRAGLTSHASINLMLALEEEFGVEFPQSMLKKSTFQSVRAISAALGELLGDVPATGKVTQVDADGPGASVPVAHQAPGSS